ncbi:MAG TPA: glycosyltransferase family 2 protein [Rubrobacteraceae bacterium]|nr:glycosyltransferase family 2 protein [Rubrobacteraceae bacterium]
MCVITYRRVGGLRRLLESLEGLIFNKAELPEMEIVVVDNDPAGSARAVCEELGSDSRWLLRYHIEPRRGISHARNAAVAFAEAPDFIAFIDDDEVPKPYWLDELLDVQKAYAADVVSGPVLTYFCDPVPNWVVRGRFFEQAFANPRYVTGHPIQLTATGNVLIRAEIFGDASFDERLGLTGGEDINFFGRVHQAGYKMVYAGDALVYEWVPGSRTNVRWILKRAYRLGNALSLSEACLDPTPAVRLVRVVKGGGRIAQGLLVLPLFVPLSLALGRHLSVKPLLHICRGTGMLAGLAGIRFEPYR